MRRLTRQSLTTTSRLGTGRLGLAALGCLVALAAAHAEQPSRAPTRAAPDAAAIPRTLPPALAGAFVAWEGGSREAGLRLWEGYLKRPPSSVPALDFYGQTSWADFQTFAWLPAFWRKANPARKLVWSIPLTVAGTPLAAVADGLHDDAFRIAAAAIAAAQPDAVVRIGWEMNVAGSLWSAPGREAEYIRAYRRVAGIFRSFSPGFRFDWCPGWGPQAGPADKAYPGDDVVDYVGLDVYDYGTGQETGQETGKGTGKDMGKPAERRWREDTLDAPFGLAWQRAFARRHGKRMSYPEWGVGQAGDNPYFVGKMADWLAANRSEIAYALYFNVDATWPSRLDAGGFPKAWDAMRTRFTARDPCCGAAGKQLSKTTIKQH